MVNETSLQAYWHGRTMRHFSTQAAEILDDLYVYGPASRAKIAERLGFRMSAVCGRVNELLARDLIEEFDKVTDPTSGKRVWVLRIREGV